VWRVKVRISKETLKGYLLEEALAYLIRNAGYNLIVDKSQDPRELETRGNGLVVVGRGGVHQADVLGQLEWIPAFTFPIRLFLEAKFRREKTGIDAVRGAVGIIDDLNQNYSPIREGSVPINRYTYTYALFSTSGFTKDAIKMAIAHKISLIDLSDECFADLRNSINECAQTILSRFAEVTDEQQDNNEDELLANENTDQDTPEGTNGEVSRQSFIKQLRMFIRRELGTWPENIEYPLEITETFTNTLRQYIGDFFRVVRRYNELYLAMANGPFLLVLNALDPDVFNRFVRYKPKHKVMLTWNSGINERHIWYISPVSIEGLPSYTLTFTLPNILAEWIFKNSNPEVQAINAKRQYLSNIYIYRLSDERDELYKLTYSYVDTQKFLEQQNNR